jgi:hypothetical protein
MFAHRPAVRKNPPTGYTGGGTLKRRKAGAGRTRLLASSPRRCSRTARSRRLRKEQGGFAAAANPKDMFLEHIEIKRKEI